MNLSKYYRIGAIYPSVVVLLIFMFSSINDRNYESEWLTADAVIGMAIITAIIYSLIMSGLSLTIFFVANKKVKESNLLTALCWFFLPLGFIAIVLMHSIKHSLEYETRIDFIYLILLNVPFIFGLIGSYLKFRRVNVPLEILKSTIKT